MKKFIIVIMFSILSCKNDAAGSERVASNDKVEIEKDVSTNTFDLEVYNYDGLEPLINKKDDKVHVVNFWATWCAPCIKELPYFENLNEKYKDKGVEVLLVSLDFPKNYDSKLKPFIKKYDVKSKVVAFDDTDQNRWIPAINKDWSGALPATIIYNSEKRQFYERSFTKEELETELNQFLK